jgi:hypothetical protein
MDAKPGSRKKRALFASLLLLVMAIPPVVNSIDNPRLAGLRGPDILRLVAIGLCLGGALTMFFVGFLGGRFADDSRKPDR